MEKKKMKLWKKILILIVVVIILFIGNLIRKSLIIQNIKNKLAQSQLETNFYISSITYQLDDDSVNVLKYYRNGENVFQKIEFSSLQSVKTYKKEGKISKYMDTPEDNICILNLSSETLPTTTVSNAFIEQLNELNKLEYIKLLINAKIKSENNYYKIKVNFLDMNPTIIMEENKTEKDYKNNYDEYLIEKDTGLIKSVNSYDNEEVISFLEYNYKFNIVTDEIFEEPDRSLYKIVDN